MGDYATLARIGPVLHDERPIANDGECIGRIEVRCWRCSRFVTYCHPSAETISDDVEQTYVCSDCKGGR